MRHLQTRMNAIRRSSSSFHLISKKLARLSRGSLKESNISFPQRSRQIKVPNASLKFFNFSKQPFSKRALLKTDDFVNKVMFVSPRCYSPSGFSRLYLNNPYKRTYTTRKSSDFSQPSFLDTNLTMRQAAFISLMLLVCLLAYWFYNKSKLKAYVDTLSQLDLAILNNAFDAFLEGEIDRSVLELISLFDRHPELQKGFELLEKGDYQAALVILDKKFIGDFQLEEPYCLLKGIVLNALDQPNMAIEYFKKAIQSKSPKIKTIGQYHFNIAQEKLATMNCKNDFNPKQTDYPQLPLYEDVYTNLIPLLLNYPFKFKKTEPFVNVWGGSFPTFEKDMKTPHDGNVHIRIWLPHRKGETGHVSLQTNKYYISFWPIDEKFTSSNAETYKIFKDVTTGWTAKNNDTLWEDIRYEQRLPDVRVSLVLDVVSIHEAFEDFGKSGYRWALLGSVLKNSQTCSGLVYYLLRAGGIRNFVDEAKISRVSYVIEKSVQITTILGYLKNIVTPIPIVPVIKFPTELIQQYAYNKGWKMYDNTITPEYVNRLVSWAFYNQQEIKNKKNTDNAVAGKEEGAGIKTNIRPP